MQTHPAKKGKKGKKAKTQRPSLMTLGGALARAEKILKTHGIPDPGREAQLMLADLLGLKPAEVYLERDAEINPERLLILNEWLQRRCRREPLQYITGSTEFRGLKIKVNHNVLIPRPETELLAGEVVAAAAAAKKKSSSPRVLDVCTGSGCIAVAVAKEAPGARLIATDISPGALKLARENASANGVAGRIKFLEGDLFKPLEERGLEGSFDVVVSNPPYVPGDELKEAQPEVRLFEPYTALYGGEDGFYFLKRIVAGAPDWLRPGGVLLVEIGFGQSGEAIKIISEAGEFEAPGIIKDLSGIERIVRARKRVG
jgi:release factor glutamine methyltransferase